MNLQQLRKLCRWMEWQHKQKEKTVITFLELRIQKKSEKRSQKWVRNSNPVLMPLSIGILDAEQPFLQQHAAEELQSVAS